HLHDLNYVALKCQQDDPSGPTSAQQIPHLVLRPQTCRIRRIRRVVADVAVEAVVAGGEADRVLGGPAPGSGIVPAGAIVVPPQVALVLAAGVLPAVAE